MVGETDNTIILQRLSRDITALVERQRAEDGVRYNGGNGSGGGNQMEGRIASIEASQRATERQIGLLESDVRRQLWGGLAAVGIILGAIATSYIQLSSADAGILSKLGDVAVSIAKLDKK